MAYPPHKIRWTVFVGLALLALAVRLPRLADRPMHTDEAVNAYITGHVLEGTSYQYDSRDRHGPALCALTVPLARMTGAKSFADLNETTLRIVPAIVGALTVLIFVFAVDQIGFVAALFAAVLFAIAPLPVYYSRYFIHETLFVAVTFGLLLCVWRWIASCNAADLRKRSDSTNFRRTYKSALRQGALAGLFAGLMLACKETALLHFGAIVLAMGCTAVTAFGGKAFSRRAPIDWRSHYVNTVTATVALLAAGVAFAGAVCVLFSWGGTHWQGVTDLIHSVPRLVTRASGEGHEKPPSYYLALLGRNASGMLVLILAVVPFLSLVWQELTQSQFGFSGGVAPVDPSSGKNPAQPPLRRGSSMQENPRWNRGHQFLVAYALVIILVYSFIPYKTPWLALNLWLPISLLAGCGVAWFWRKVSNGFQRAVMIAAFIVLVVSLGHDTWLHAFAKPADEKNPYAYAHTGEDLLRLPDRLTELTGKKSKEFRIAVVAADPWPLPWYLRKFPQVGFWQPGQDPGPADVYITSPEVADQLTERLANRRPEFFGVRPEVLVILWPPP